LNEAASVPNGFSNTTRDRSARPCSPIASTMSEGVRRHRQIVQQRHRLVAAVGAQADRLTLLAEARDGFGADRPAGPVDRHQQPPRVLGGEAAPGEAQPRGELPEGGVGRAPVVFGDGVVDLQPELLLGEVTAAAADDAVSLGQHAPARHVQQRRQHPSSGEVPGRPVDDDDAARREPHAASCHLRPRP